MLDLYEPVEDGLIYRDAGGWVRYKLDYLERYINLFETSMRNKWPVRFYIDLLAGCGKNKIRENNEIVLGSPLVALKTKYPFSHYIFNEVQAEDIQALKKRVDAMNHSSNIYFFDKDCNLVIEEIMSMIEPFEGQSLNLAFIDPEGLEVEWQTIERITRIRRIDLLIYYPEQAINRLVKIFCQEEDECKIDKFFGDREWRNIYTVLEKSNSLKCLHRELLNYLWGKLSLLGYVDFSTDHIHDVEPLMSTGQTRAPLYRLIFASKHKLGNSFWKEVVRKDITGQKSLF